MALQHSYTDEKTGITYPEAYGKIDKYNIVDTSEVFKTIIVEGNIQNIIDPKGSIQGKYVIWANEQSRQEDRSPLLEIPFNIGNGYMNKVEDLDNNGNVIGYTTEYIEKLDDVEQLHMKWGDVFDGITADFSDRDELRKDIVDAIYAYITTKTIAGIDLTQALSV